MSVTIYEIAEKAGVSTSTVSRVLRGTVKETWESSAKRAAHIRQVAEELGYRPNLRARAFSEQKTMAVGLIYVYNSQVFDATSREIVQGITEVLSKRGYHLVLVPFDDRSHWREMLLGRQLDGCLLLNFSNEAITNLIDQGDLPSVLIGVRSESDLPQIESDDYGGGYKAGRHLLAMGHRRIAYYVSEEIRPHYSVEERRKGIEDSIADFGMDAVLETHLRVSEQRFVNSLLERGNQTTAIVTYCDIESISLSHILPKFGISIPRDMSLMGFNDVFPTQLMSPPLTMVRFDTKQIGEAAANAMLAQMEGKDWSESEKLVVEQAIVVRESTGPVPKKGSPSGSKR